MGARAGAPPNESGSYVLVLRSPDETSLEVGRLGTVTIRRGFYLYVGSAFGPGGLRARIGRHAGRPSCLHWHVDYLRRATVLIAVWYGLHDAHLEHEWARTLNRGRGVESAWPRFGASDCDCETHLFFACAEPSSVRFEQRLRRAGLPNDLFVWGP